MMAKSQEKSWFIRRLKEELDCQAEELADLRSRKEQARRDANEAEKTTSYYLDKVLKDGEEIAAIKNVTPLVLRACLAPKLIPKRSQIKT